MQSEKQLLIKITRYCAEQERCESDIRQKLQNWGAESTQIDDILVYLENENYWNQARFAKAFAHDKFRFEQWGKIKIAYQLRQKGLDESLIQEALQYIDPTEYRELAEKLAAKKWATLQKTPLENKAALQRYLAQKGFENALVWDISDKFFS